MTPTRVVHDDESGLILNEPDLKCHYCVPNEQLFNGPEFGQELHEHHVRLFHLNSYKPFTCSQCNKTFSAGTFAFSHGQQEHAGQAQIVTKPNGMLDALCKVMVRANQLASNKQTESAVQMLKDLQVDVTVNGNPPEAESEAEPQVDVVLPEVPELEVLAEVNRRLIYCRICEKLVGHPLPKAEFSTGQGRKRHVEVHMLAGGTYEEKYERCFPGSPIYPA